MTRVVVLQEDPLLLEIREALKAQDGPEKGFHFFGREVRHR